MRTVWRWLVWPIVTPGVWAMAAGRWYRTRLARLAAFAAGNAQAVTFTLALCVASAGFGLAWLPLGLIVPGTTVCAIMVAWRWQSTFGNRDD